MKRIIPIYKADAPINIGLPTVEQVDDAASRNVAKLTGTELSLISGLVGSVREMVTSHELTHEEKQNALLHIVGRITSVVAPVSSCGEGCSACRHMAVGISGWEARRIADYIGVAPVKVEPIRTPDQLEVFEREHNISIEALIGVPCTFLVNNRCSIYDVRPMACRTHYNLSDYPDICDTTVSKMDVPNFDFRPLWGAATYLGMEEAVFGDIRMFFPDPFPKPFV